LAKLQLSLAATPLKANATADPEVLVLPWQP